MSQDSARLSDTEALMWTLEQDPMFSSNIGAIALMDRRVDVGVLRNKMLHAVAELPRLRQRIASSSLGMSPPAWEVDRDFEIEYHVRHIALPDDAGRRELLDVATRILQDPMDRTRPLWMFVVIDLPDGTSAMMTKLHHTVADGEGSVRLAERYMEIDEKTTDPGPIDLQPILDADAEHAAESAGPDLGDVTDAVGKAVGSLRKLAGDAAITWADPARIPERGADVVAGLRQLADQLGPTQGGSGLWSDRTRRRRLDTTSIPFVEARDASRALGGSLNDLFVCATVEAAARYHADADDDSESVVVSFIVSTREKGSSVTSNSFTPSKLVAPLAPTTIAERFAALHEELNHRKSDVRGAGLLSDVAGAVNMLPSGLLSRMARMQATGVDIATSNVRAAPFAVYVAGAKVDEVIPVGPVAGTAVNITMMSYDGRLDIGVHSDPVAVRDPELFVNHLEAAFADLIAAGRG